MNSDTKKIIEMVAVIGILLIFVGVATRIRQNSQVTLSTYSSDKAEGSHESSELQESQDSSGTQENSISSSTESNSISSGTQENSNSTSSVESNITSSADSDSNASSSNTMTQEEYDAFYYTDNDDGTSNVNIMYYIYYDNEYTVQDGTLICDSDIAYDLLDIFYTLYKNKYPLTEVANDPAYIYSDECTKEFENNELRSNNVTYCKGKNIYINPLYNPYVSYDENGNTTILPENQYSSYDDRDNNKGMYFIDRNDLAYYLFTQKGFLWGGDMSGSKDYSLFYKN